MTPHDIAIHRIESELKYIPTSILPVHIAERACMAAYLSYELSVITAQERDDLVKRIRAAEMIRFRELLEAAA
jgi:L-asparagine transporter-like permease